MQPKLLDAPTRRRSCFTLRSAARRGEWEDTEFTVAMLDRGISYHLCVDLDSGGGTFSMEATPFEIYVRRSAAPSTGCGRSEAQKSRTLCTLVCSRSSASTCTKKTHWEALRSLVDPFGG